MELKSEPSRLLARYLFDSREMGSGNRVDILCDGPQIFSTLLDRIQKAQREIALEMYMFEDDSTGQQVLEALVAAAERGVRVRVIYDGIGSLWTKSSFFVPLHRAGGETFIYHPPFPWLPGWGIRHRNHRKMVLVDADWVLIGGMNLADEYEKPPVEGGFHDLAIAVTGPSCSEGWRLFESTWRRRWFGQGLRPATSGTVGFQKDTALAEIVGSGRFRNRWKIRRRILHAIDKAERSIDILNPYFLPDSGVIRALARAVARGVHVRIVLPRVSDVPVVDLASLVPQWRLARVGVEIHGCPGVLHAKAVLVDEIWLSVGSYNFDHLSLFNNLEVVVNALDPRSGLQLNEIVERDVARSVRLSTEHFSSLPWWKKTAARLVYRLRAFL